MAGKTIITCALTGGAAFPREHPNFPVTPRQLAEQGLEAANAGASILHIHVRNPETGAPSTALALYREVHDRTRQANPDLIINLTHGPGCMFFPPPVHWPVAPEGTNMMSAEAPVAH